MTSKLLPLIVVMALLACPPLPGQDLLERLERDVQDVAEKVRPFHVIIKAVKPCDDASPAKTRLVRQIALSGVLLDPKGMIVTAAEPLEGARLLQVDLVDGRYYRAKLVGFDRVHNLAFLSIPGEGLATPPLAASSDVRPGQFLIAFGHPFGLAGTVYLGMVTGECRTLAHDSTSGFCEDGWIQTSLPLNPGDSAGLVANSKGEILGILLTQYSCGSLEEKPKSGDRRTSKGPVIGFWPSGGEHVRDLAFVFPIQRVREVQATILEAAARGLRPEEVEETPSAGWLGVTLSPAIDEETRRHLEGLPAKWGHVITGVCENGPARKAGIRRGDVLIRYGEYWAGWEQRIGELILSTTPGTEVVLLILREGERKQIPVIVGGF